ncbi:MAG: hypothetical protein Athens071426_662 [Parcubacteria group bacterium Athens0714_26]|nr:MAG: hypothetical protein Athens101426_481 [Parcubacteria group bacterium Athens1014_26]TSD01541.1 MAG: hypothetical protein Athens071426_662 [Parcubacteria group bacterium Athens0714_26]
MSEGWLEITEASRKIEMFDQPKTGSSQFSVKRSEVNLSRPEIIGEKKIKLANTD